MTKVPQTLLLADDSVTIQRVIELTFADEDIDVVAVSDGDQAIARLDGAPPDIVLVDVGMPGKSGYEVAAYVKQSPRLSHIPVVLLTGAFEPVDEARATGVGCDGVLAKPFEPHQVIGRVKELLSRPARPIGSLDGVFGAHATPEAPAPDLKSIDDYFDQLDAAFSSLPGKAPQSAEPAVPPEIDWFGLKHAAPAPTTTEPALPLRPVEAPQPAWAKTAHQIPMPPPIPEPPATEPAPEQEPLPIQATDNAAAPPAAPPAVAGLPPLADAFAALLEAEQGQPAPTAPPAWPGAVTAGAAAGTDDLVERVSRRVLEQLTDRAVRETVATLAERLIREEIERIKKSIE